MKYRFILACCLLVGAAARPSSAAPAPGPAGAPSKTTVTLDLKQTPLHQALGLLFDQLGLQYTIDSDVPDVPITMRVHDLPYGEAIRALLRLGTTDEMIQGAGIVHHEVTYTKDGDLYEIHVRRDEPSPEPVAVGIGGVGGVGFSAPPPAPAVEKVPVNFLRPDDAVTYLSRQPVAGVVSIQPLPHDNSLVVRGDPDAIQNLKRLLQLADVPSRPLHVSVGVSGPGFNGAPLAIRSSARALVGDDLTIDEGATISGQPADLKVTLQTHLLGTGDLQVASDWYVHVPVAGGPKGPIRLVKRLSTTTLVPLGQQVPVAEVDLAGWGGKGVLRLWIQGDWGDHLMRRSGSPPHAQPARLVERHAH